MPRMAWIDFIEKGKREKRKEKREQLLKLPFSLLSDLSNRDYGILMFVPAQFLT